MSNDTVMDTLKQHVIEYIDTTKKLQDMSKDTKDLTQKKKVLSETIIGIMNDRQVDACKLHNGDALVMKTTVRFEALKPEFVQSNLETFFEGAHDFDNPAEEAMAHIMKNREETSTQSLKIVKNK